MRLIRTPKPILKVWVNSVLRLPSSNLTRRKPLCKQYDSRINPANIPHVNGERRPGLAFLDCYVDLRPHNATAHPKPWDFRKRLKCSIVWYQHVAASSVHTPFNDQYQAYKRKQKPRLRTSGKLQKLVVGPEAGRGKSYNVQTNLATNTGCRADCNFIFIYFELHWNRAALKQTASESWESLESESRQRESELYAIRAARSWIKDSIHAILGVDAAICIEIRHLKWGNFQPHIRNINVFNLTIGGNDHKMSQQSSLYCPFSRRYNHLSYLRW